jgi:hypothetical protein
MFEMTKAIELAKSDLVKDYENVSVSFAADIYIKEIMETYNVPQKQARQLFVAALLSNLVNVEVFDQVNYLVKGEV